MSVVICETLLNYKNIQAKTPDNVTLSIQDYGAIDGGRDVLFIHGFSQANLSWLKQVSGPIAKKHRIVTFDMRGHGASDTPNDLASLKDPQCWADDIRTVIDAANLRKPIIVAWSYSGRVVLDYVKTYGAEQLSGLIMIAATSTTKPGVLGSLTPALKAMATAPDLAENIDATLKLLNGCMSVPAQPDERALMLGFNLQTAVATRAAMAGRAADYDDTLRSIKLPTLIVQGKDDPINTVEMSKHSASLIEGAELLVYENCGHLPFWEHNQRFDKDVLVFLEKID